MDPRRGPLAVDPRVESGVMTLRQIPGWFSSYRKQPDGPLYVRFRWADAGKKRAVYLGSLGITDERLVWPTDVLAAVVNKIMRLDLHAEDDQQRERHWEMLCRLRALDKSWSNLEN